MNINNLFILPNYDDYYNTYEKEDNNIEKMYTKLINKIGSYEKLKKNVFRATNIVLHNLKKDSIDNISLIILRGYEYKRIPLTLIYDINFRKIIKKKNDWLWIQSWII